MAVQRAMVVDRDAMLLSRLAAELGQNGYSVETLASTIGLTPDLLDLFRPDLVVIDAELPDMGRPALLVIVRSLQARRRTRIVLSTSGDPAGVAKLVPVDQVVARAELARRGAAALGLEVAQEPVLDLRALIDRVLGQGGESAQSALPVCIDLFSKSNFYVSPGQARPCGIFLATAALLPLGQKVALDVELLSRTRMKLHGEVAWKRAHSSFGGRMPTGMGIRLVELSDSDKESIDRFADAREPFVGPV